MSSPVSVWDFTIGSEYIELDDLKGILSEHCKKWAFQLEKGSETDYEHYQGRISLKVKARLGKIIKLFNIKEFHFTPTSTQNMGNDFYVIKEDTRINGPWKDTDVVRYIPRQVREIQQLYPWQQYVINDADVWDTRTINIIYDPKGHQGKTILKTYIGSHGIGRAIPYVNDYRDMLRIVMDTPKVKLYIIDIPRAITKDRSFQFWSAVETLKDGHAYDDRYCFKEEYFDCPNIWIYMNEIPDNNLLSKDRWKIWVINDQKELEPYEEGLPKDGQSLLGEEFLGASL